MSEPFLSEIRIFGFNFPPRGWAQCNGQILPINQNQSLYSLLGTTYGGDGRTSFALRALRSGGTSQSLQSCQSYWTLRTLWTNISWNPLGPCWTFCACLTLRSLKTSWTCRANIAQWTCRAWFALQTR